MPMPVCDARGDKSSLLLYLRILGYRTWRSEASLLLDSSAAEETEARERESVSSLTMQTS